MVRPALATYIGSYIKLMSWRIPECVDHEVTAIITTYLLGAANNISKLLSKP